MVGIPPPPNHGREVYAQRPSSHHGEGGLCAEAVLPPWEGEVYAQRLSSHLRRRVVYAQRLSSHLRKNGLCAEAVLPP